MSYQLKPFRLTVCVAVLCSLPFVSGCETDKLVVFEDGLLTAKDMKPFLGKYAVEKWFGEKFDPETDPKSIVIDEEGGRCCFSYLLPGKRKATDVKRAFLLSRIPNTKLDLLLFSIPKPPEAKTKDNDLFLICRVHEGKTYLWAVDDDEPMAKGRIKAEKGKFRSEDVKAFLKNFADAYVTANDPLVVLAKSE